MANIVCIDPVANFNAYGFFRLPVMGLLSVGTIWQQLGHKVKIISEAFGRVYDAANHRLSPSLISRLTNADVLALSVMTPTANRCYDIAEAAREKFPHLKIIMGGPHVSYQEEEALQYTNVVVKGEGDYLPVLTAALEATGVIQGSLIDNLNSLPFPDFSLIKGYPDWLRGQPSRRGRPWERIQKFFPRYVPILGSRGCPFDCTFCIVSKMYGRRYRFRTPENVVEEMRLRVSQGAVPHFFFYDDNLGANPGHAKELLELIISEVIEPLPRGLQHQFKLVGEARADIASDEELLALLAKAHCHYLYIGFESINPETLQAYNKKQTVEDIKRCIQRLKARGIKIQGMFVVGSNHDSVETLNATVRFAQKMEIDTIQISIQFPIPGTKLEEQLENEERIITRDWSLYDGTMVVFQPKLMTMRELQEGLLRAWRTFYWEKANYWHRLATIIGKRWWERTHRAAFERLARQFESQ